MAFYFDYVYLFLYIVLIVHQSLGPERNVGGPQAEARGSSQEGGALQGAGYNKNDDNDNINGDDGGDRQVDRSRLSIADLEINREGRRRR